MAITSLSAQYISASFQNLVQVSSSGQLFDGAGNQITNLTASFAVTASYALNAGTGTSINTGSFATTGSNAFNGSQTITGNLIVTGSLTATAAVTASLVSASAGLITDNIQFNTNTSTAVAPGQLAWNNSDGTLDLGMKGGTVVQQIGQEIFYEVRNETLSTIDNGTVLYATGVTVGSGRITAAPFTADGSVREVRLLGMATENISNGVNGFVTHFGYVRGSVSTPLDTRGNVASSIAVGDETWAVGDILYAHPTVAGKLTNVRPKHEISIAIIIVRHQTVGVVFVRPASYGHLDDIHDVSINTGSLATGDLLIYNSGSDLWTNSNQLSGSYSVKGIWNVTGSLTVTGSSTFKVIGPSEFTGSVAINGTLSAPAATITAQSVTASLFGTASYAVNSLTASYALSGGSGGTSATVATAQTGSVSSTTSETLIQTLTIPANTLATDNFARISTKIFATNSSNYTVALYINSANTLNGSEKNITTLPVNSAIKFVVPTRTIAVNNVTTNTNWISENTQGQEPFQGTSALAHASSSIDWTTTQYALVSVTPQNAGDSFICRGTYFEKI
jgi:hypothetical protein